MSSSSTLLDSLPAVLVQLTMQWMQLSEMLQFARCSRPLLSQADSPFAFKFIKPVRVGLFALPEAGIVEPTCKLARHVSLTVMLDRSREMCDDLCDPDPLSILRRLPRSAHSFTIAKHDSGSLRAFAEHPATQHLQSLVIGDDVRYSPSLFDAESISAIARMPQLTSLLLRMHRSSAELIRELSQSLSLTSLNINDTSFCAPSILDGLSECVRFRHLSIKTPWLYDDQFVGIFATPCFRGLESMVWDHTVLYGDDSQPAMQTEWARRALASMHALREFTVRLTFGIDLLMPAVSAAPALRLFTINANCDPVDASQLAVLPSSVLTCALLRDAPALSIVIDMSAFHKDNRTEYANALETALLQLDESMRSRLTLRRCAIPLQDPSPLPASEASAV